MLVQVQVQVLARVPPRAPLLAPVPVHQLLSRKKQNPNVAGVLHGGSQTRKLMWLQPRLLPRPPPPLLPPP